MEEVTKGWLTGITRHTITSLASIALAFSLFWALVKPHAEDFIKTAVAKEQYVKAQDALNLETRVVSLEGKVGALLEASSTQARSQYRMESDISSIKDMQKEQREDIKQLLKGFGRP